MLGSGGINSSITLSEASHIPQPVQTPPLLGETPMAGRCPSFIPDIPGRGQNPVALLY